MLLLFERHPPETRRRPRRLSRWAALLLVIAVIMRSGHVWAQPATPSTLQQESLTLKDGTPAGQILDLFRLVLAQVKVG